MHLITISSLDLTKHCYFVRIEWAAVDKVSKYDCILLRYFGIEIDCDVTKYKYIVKRQKFKKLPIVSFMVWFLHKSFFLLPDSPSNNTNTKNQYERRLSPEDKCQTPSNRDPSNIKLPWWYYSPTSSNDSDEYIL